MLELSSPTSFIELKSLVFGAIRGHLRSIKVIVGYSRFRVNLGHLRSFKVI